MEPQAELTQRMEQQLRVLAEQARRERDALNPQQHLTGISKYDKLFDSLQTTLHNLDCVEDDG